MVVSSSAVNFATSLVLCLSCSFRESFSRVSLLTCSSCTCSSVLSLMSTSTCCSFSLWRTCSSCLSPARELTSSSRSLTLPCRSHGLRLPAADGARAAELPELLFLGAKGATDMVDPLCLEAKEPRVEVEPLALRAFLDAANVSGVLPTSQVDLDRRRRFLASITCFAAVAAEVGAATLCRFG
uniref:Putative secreted protein n=1 Tax=Ixodes ricinus TaxID=34613 RepID=A0A6B0V014_IXORI